MCHIITAISKKPLGKEMASRIVGSSYVAYQNNSHMEGMYANHEDASEFSLDKTTFEKIKENIAQSTVVIYHARLSTSGLEFNNVQPFIQDNYVFAHNGVYSIKRKLEDKDKSDSKIVFEAFLARVKDKDVPTAYQEAVEAVCDTAASFSTFIYDIVNQDLWYTKSTSTSITAYAMQDMVIFSSRDVRALSEISTATYKIDHNHWYHVNPNQEKFVLLDAGSAVYNMPKIERDFPFNNTIPKDTHYGYKWGEYGYWEKGEFHPFERENKKKEEREDLEKRTSKGVQQTMEGFGLGRNEEWDWQYDEWEDDTDEWNNSFASNGHPLGRYR